MKCETVHHNIENYLEGRLAQLDRNEFVTHVTACPDCEAELLAWRGMFRALRSMRREPAPARIATAVMARVRAEGLVYEPDRSTMQRVLDRFFALPARTRYPLAASIVIASLYGPLAALVGLVRGSFDSSVSALAGLYAMGATALQSVSFVRDVGEAGGAYARAAQTVLSALHQAFGGDARVAIVALVVTAAAAGLATKRKRVGRHATFGF